VITSRAAAARRFATLARQEILHSSFFILHFQHCKGTENIPYWQAFSPFVSELFEMLK
jgi:hypothetical protein